MRLFVHPVLCLGLTLIAVSLLVSRSVMAQPAALSRSSSMSEAFFAANQLRAAGQRVTRLYLESGTGVRPNRTRSLLEQETRAYDELLSKLSRQRLDPQLYRHITKVVSSWAELKPVVTSKFGRENAELAYSLSEQLYIQTSKVTSHLEDQAQSEMGYLADVAGRNAAFAERIAKSAFLYATTRRAGALVDFETWRKEYTDGYARLEDSPLNDEYTRSNLKLGRMMWMFFDDVLTVIVRKNDTSRMLEVAKSVDGMWEIAQSSKKQYEVMFRQQLRQGGQFAAQPARRGS